MALTIDVDAERRRLAARHPRKFKLHPLPTIPTALDAAELRKALADVARLRAELAKASADVQATQRAVEAAANADRAAYAQALRLGKPDPGTPESERAAAKLADANRRHDALRLAVLDSESEATALVADNRAAFQAQLAEEREKAAATARERLSALVASRRHIADLDTFAAWLTGAKRGNDGQASVAIANLVRSLTTPPIADDDADG